MKIYELTDFVINVRKSAEIAQRVSNMYPAYKDFKDFADSLADYFEKNGKGIIYATSNWTEGLSKSVNQYSDFVELKIEFAKKYRKGSVKKTVSKLIYELNEIKECINKRNVKGLEEHFSTFNKTISNLKYDYFVNLDPSHKMEFKLLRNVIEKLKDSRNIYLNTQVGFENALKFGDILLYFNMESRKSFFTRAITNFTNSYIIHAGIYVGKGKILEANETTGKVDYVNVRPTANNQIIVVMRGDLKPEQLAMIANIAQNFKDSKTGYGYLELIGQAIFQKTGSFPKIFRNKHAYYCSELVSEVYTKIGYPITPGLSSQHSAPGDIIDSRYLRVSMILDNLKEDGYSDMKKFLEDLELTLHTLQTVLEEKSAN